MKLHLNTCIEITIPDTEIERYEGLRKVRGLKAIGQALIELAQVIKTRPMKQWIVKYEEIADLKPTHKSFEDDKLVNFMGDASFRLLSIAHALLANDLPSHTHRFVKLQKALAPEAMSPLNYEVTELSISQS